MSANIVSIPGAMLMIITFVFSYDSGMTSWLNLPRQSNSVSAQSTFPAGSKKEGPGRFTYETYKTLLGATAVATR